MDDIKEFVDFIREIYSQSDFIPLHEPRFGDREKEFVVRCIDSTLVSSVGEFVEQFEDGIATYTGVSKAVAVVNGTQALYLSLILAGAMAGKEVITQSLTFIATANAISNTGAKPIFIDVEKETMGMSPVSLKQFLESETELVDGVCCNRQTRNQIVACVPMHTFGLPCKIDEIRKVCCEYNLILVEDAAESLGSFVANKHTGTFGAMGIISFNGNKIITTGGGGMILFKDEKLAQKAKHISTTAKVMHPWEYIHDEIGFNFRMPNLNAALGVAQLKSLPRFVKEKNLLNLKYREFFTKKQIHCYSANDGSTSNYWLNAIQLEDKKTRDYFLKTTNEYGVMTRGIWTPMHHLPMFANCQQTDLSNTDFLFERVVNIPSSSPTQNTEQ